MFILPNFCLKNIIFINLNMFEIARSIIQNSIKLKSKVVNHQSSFPS